MWTVGARIWTVNHSILNPQPALPTEPQKGEFQLESLFHNGLSSITWSPLQSQRATVQNDLITLAVDFKETGRRNGVNCSQDF